MSHARTPCCFWITAFSIFCQPYGRLFFLRSQNAERRHSIAPEMFCALNIATGKLHQHLWEPQQFLFYVRIPDFPCWSLAATSWSHAHLSNLHASPAHCARSQWTRPGCLKYHCCCVRTTDFSVKLIRQTYNLNPIYTPVCNLYFLVAHVNYSHGCRVSIWLHSLLRQELFMSNHVSAHVRGSGLTHTSWQSDAFAHTKNNSPAQRDTGSIAHLALILTYFSAKQIFWGIVKAEALINKTKFIPHHNSHKFLSKQQ